MYFLQVYNFIHFYFFGKKIVLTCNSILNFYFMLFSYIWEHAIIESDYIITLIIYILVIYKILLCIIFLENYIKIIYYLIALKIKENLKHSIRKRRTKRKSTYLIKCLFFTHYYKYFLIYHI